jgi:hypothetical protein
MAQQQAIAPSNLLVDLETPRLPQPNTGQSQAERELAGHLQRLVLGLAKEIVKYGLNPSDLPFVMPLVGDDLNRGRPWTAVRILSCLSDLCRHAPVAPVCFPQERPIASPGASQVACTHRACGVSLREDGCTVVARILAA